MALQDHLLAEKANIIALLEAEYADQNLREQLLERLFYIRQLLGELAADVGSITVTGGDASAANQTNVQANAGADASKALAIQGITGGKALNVNVTESFALETGGNLATIAGAVGTDGGSTPSRTLLVGGVHDGTIQTIKVDSQGRVLLNPTDQQTKVDSLSVTIASDQGNLGNITNVTGTISLPTGASTSAKQDTGNSSLASIDGKLPSGLTISSTRLLTDGSGVTQPVSAASLPLPTGAATSANQSTANSSLSSIDTKLPSGLTVSSGRLQVDPLIPTPAFLFTSTITRAANTTAYTANDVYGAAFELVSSPAPTSGQWILITDIEIIFNITALPSGMAGFQLYTYGVAAPSAVTDNSAFSLPSGDRSAIIFPNGIPLGSAALARGGGSVVAQANNINFACKLSGTSLFAYLVTLAAFTPAANSETATIRVRALAL